MEVELAFISVAKINELLALKRKYGLVVGVSDDLGTQGFLH